MKYYFATMQVHIKEGNFFTETTLSTPCFFNKKDIMDSFRNKLDEKVLAIVITFFQEITKEQYDYYETNKV